MSPAEVDRLVAAIADQYPPFIHFEEAATIARTPKGTIEHWSSSGHFDEIKRKPGRRVLLVRDAFVRWLLSQQA